jgi:Uma2 family endonuclease
LEEYAMTPLVGQALPGTQVDPLYPDSDGRPLGETDYHSAAMIWLREALQDHFAARPDVYVASNLLLYYQRGNPPGRRDPDVLVAKGVGKHIRRSFRVWEENVMPQVLFEISSLSTWQEDLYQKRTLYASLGVTEYFLFDPEGLCLDPRLQGFRLEQGDYVALTPDADGGLESVELGLRFTIEEHMLRLTDMQTGIAVPTQWERAEQERQRADYLAAEVARLQAILRQLNGHA